jgi:hypothetical protein
LRGIGVGLGRFDAALQRAEQIELVRRADTDVADVGHRTFSGSRKASGFLQALRAHLHAAAPATGRFGFIDLRTSPRQVGRRHAQIGVGCHGLLHQLIQTRVLIQPPPVRRHRRRHHWFAVHRQFALKILRCTAASAGR